MKRALRIFSFLLSIVIIISLFAGCSHNSSKKASVVNTKPFSKLKQGSEVPNDGIITENNRFIMTWNSFYSQVVITDKQNNAVYSTMPIDAMEIKYDEDGYEIMNNIQIESPLIVNYYNPETLSEDKLFASSDAIKDGKIFSEEINDGIRITYVFTSHEISVPVEYRLKNDCFEISVDPKEIYDNGESFVTGVAVAPFLCSLGNNSTDSYFLIPDGSGAIINPQSIDHIGRQGGKRVYGEDITVNRFTLTSFEEKMNMPIFGEKHGDTGLLAIITSSAERAYINWDIGANAKKYSSVYPFFKIRGYNIIKRPSGFMMSLAEIPIFDDYIVEEPLTVEYRVLDKENASYSGMANIYREYLLNNNKLKKQEDSDVVGVFRLLGGTTQKTFHFGIPSTKLAKLTTISEAKEIAEYLSKNIKDEIMLELTGFGESGIDVGKVGGGFKIAGELGNKKDINSLAEFCKSNKIKLFMDFDVIGFNKRGNGFSPSKDSAKSYDGQTVYLGFYNNVSRVAEGKTKYVLLSREKLGLASAMAAKTANNYGFDGLSLSSVSNVAYSDYSTKGCGVSGLLSEYVTKAYSGIAKDTSIVSNNANEYSAGISNFITETPTVSSQYDIAVRDVPFYQMVFKGYVPMSASSVNLMADYDIAVLKCIESGIAPTFTLSNNYDNSLAQTKYSAIPLSKFDGLKEKIVQTVKETSVITQKVKGASIKNHTVTENGLRITEFDNGVKIAVNYTEQDLTFDNMLVPAEKYIVLEG